MSGTLRERIFSKLLVDPSGCLLWQGALRNGYGVVGVQRDGAWRADYVHRLMYEMFAGPIPDGLVIDHLCRVRSCGSPAHLEPVTNYENRMRGFSPAAVAARATACPSGHPYAPRNTYVGPDGSRKCRQCAREYQARRRARERTSA